MDIIIKPIQIIFIGTFLLRIEYPWPEKTKSNGKSTNLCRYISAKPRSANPNQIPKIKRNKIDNNGILLSLAFFKTLNAPTMMYKLKKSMIAAAPKKRSFENS